MKPRIIGSNQIERDRVCERGGRKRATRDKGISPEEAGSGGGREGGGYDGG